ncbi:MAG: MBL fold metallo-hydrolase [Hyphomicrobiaceae bacterium]|nr:MBL fold metallo-hydrolase [Hyphomicrobiaceae bacterium]
MRIRLLGTGTPTPSLRRMCSGYVIETSKDVIVMDHGFGAHHRLLELGIPATKVTHLFFSHLHYDHCGDYGRLLLTRWDQGANRIPELKVFGPAPIAELTERLFGTEGVYNPDLVARTSHGSSLDLFVARGGTLPRPRPAPRVTTLKPGDLVEGDGWTLKTLQVNHFQPYLVTLGFRLTTSQGVFVYSGDSGPAESMHELAKGCDVLVHMCHYLSGTNYSAAFAHSCMGHMELAHLAREAGVRNLVLTHITEQFDRPGLRERVVADMGAVYKGNIFFGEDLMEIPLKGPETDRLL